MNITEHFVENLQRQEFRNYFQPSRIVIGLVRDSKSDKINPITICFSMYASYKPNIISFAIHKINYSFHLFNNAEICCLSVPGESLVNETMYFGIESGKSEDKLKQSGILLTNGIKTDLKLIRHAIANLECEIVHRVVIGDHLIVFCRVLGFWTNRRIKEKNLLSIGVNMVGYRLLKKKGIHRIAVVDG